MSVSILTKKGQTTIPKDIHKTLGLKPNDRILHIVEGEKVVLRPLKGSILDLKGTVKANKKPIDFQKLRDETLRRVARQIKRVEPE
jgi:AbrB family looped-hinge helix DNA binding protein